MTARESAVKGHPGVYAQSAGGYRGRYRALDGKLKSTPVLDRIRDVEALLEAARTDQRRGQPLLDERRARVTLDQWWTLWTPTRHRVRPYVRDRDTRRYQLHIAPQLGRAPLPRITPHTIETWLSWQASTGRSIAMQRSCHSLLLAALTAAVKDGRLRANPCAQVAAPKPDHDRTETWHLLSRNQFDALLAAADERYRALFLVVAYTGLRASEIVGLRRGDVNPLRAELTVAQGVVYDKGALHTGLPKSRRKRTIPLHPAAHDALRTHIAARNMPPSAPLFTSPRGSLIRWPHFTARIFKPALEKAGLPSSVRFHDLRHSCASWLLDGGLTITEVRDVLGHSSVTVTEGYTHTDRNELAVKMTRALSGKRKRAAR